MVLIGVLAVIWGKADSNGAQLAPNEPTQKPPSRLLKELARSAPESCLGSEDMLVRRRAILEMVGSKANAERIVDAIMADKQYVCSKAIVILGKSALPRLYYYLADANEDIRHSVLPLIALAGQPDANALAVLHKLSREHPNDKGLQVLVELIIGPSPTVAEAQIKTLESTSESAVASSVYGVEWLLATQEKTREWIINRARTHLNEAITNLRDGKFTLSELESLWPKILLLAFAARSQPLGQKGRECLKELELEISKHDGKYDSLMPALFMTRWMAGGKREPALLDKALALFGRDAIGCEGRTLGGEIITFGDIMLSPDDIPVLLSRAMDERAKEQVRIGALRLLPSVPIMGETTASWFITVEGKEVERWKKQGCWGWKRRWRAERKEGVARLEFRPPPRPRPRGARPPATES
ncbi:MAG: hypothetical protein L6306_07710 [Planctomycetales bacterium]|nr:hypothetical protein [Planctomycetales bacterium]